MNNIHSIIVELTRRIDTAQKNDDIDGQFALSQFRDWILKDTTDKEMIKFDEYKAAIRHSRRIVNSKGSAKDVKYPGRPMNNPFR